jgi:GNAT superfamily N-acetyltransferase
MPQDERGRPETTSDTLVCCLSRDLPEPRRTNAILFCTTAWKADKPTGAHAIGFLPTAAYTNRDAWGELLVLYNNDDLVAFCMMSKVSAYQELRCLQIWVRPDARMILHGRALIEKLNEIANDRGAKVLRLWCAEDLAANLFWKQLGFRYRGWRWGAHKKARRHALWCRRVTQQNQPPTPVTAAPAQSLVV